jgi:hypothetical protein
VEFNNLYSALGFTGVISLKDDGIVRTCGIHGRDEIHSKFIVRKSEGKCAHVV